MATDEILRTYGDNAVKTDIVLNAIELLTAQESQIFNMLGKTVAIALTHIYQTDTLATAASSAVGQAADYTAGVQTTPSNLANVVEHIARPFKVSYAQKKAQHYHGQSELERQTTKALKEWGNSAEFDLVRSTLVSGVSGTVPKMLGIIQAISKANNHTSHNSGTVWNATILDSLVANNYDNSNGDLATDLFMGSFLRKATDGFTAKSNVVVNSAAGETALVRTVSTYQTAFGTLKIHTHRYIQQSSDATGRILAIRPEKLKIAFFEAPYIDKDLARSGPYDFRAVAGSLTLETLNQDSGFYADGFDKD